MLCVPPNTEVMQMLKKANFIACKVQLFWLHVLFDETS